MGQRTRGLNDQFQHAISTCYVQTSKKADNHNKQFDNSHRLYSVGRTEDLRGLAKSFSKFMKINHPEIKQVKDVNRDHVYEYLQSNKPNWNNRVMIEKISQFRKIEIVVDYRYNCKPEFSKDIYEPKDKEYEKIRCMKMEKTDLDKLVEKSETSKSNARDGLQFGKRFGLRADGVTWIKGTNINLEDKTLTVKEKNGKIRQVPIKDKDMDFCKEMKEKYGENRICSMTPENYNKQLRRWMKTIKITNKDGKEILMDKKYEKQSQHSIRKLWVQERMAELTGRTERPEDPKGTGEICKLEREAWKQVQKEIGHEDKYFRLELYNTYCKTSN